ncbi:uncharacterized protein LOC133404247 isoform X3 [Phycodurus eques]|uniref:uncharacterized protein LOC133404247 isoform X3 n=1 Tax=Phycodurus eques TaxID=693459 RepID=UPI002ACD3CE2|nr:uncharacterized protein LOC133404247 isoform X3 [Phycodurus eques]
MLFTRFCSTRMSTTLPRHVVWESERLVAYLHPRPWTPGSVILERRVPGTMAGSIFHLEEAEYLSWMLGAKAVAQLLCDKLRVHRCALVTRPHVDRPAQAGEEEHHTHDPGYCTSKTAPRWSDARLKEVQARIRAKLPNPDAPPNLTFLGDDLSHPGLFPRIVRGEEPHWRLWEDEAHVSFLTPFPNLPGFTVLVPRRPLSSDIFGLGESDYEGLVLAARKVSHLLEKGLGAWGVGLIFEGFEIDYAHAKLIPLLQLPSSGEGNHSTPPAPHQCFLSYPGYVTSEDGPGASLESLEEMYAKMTLK